MMGRSSVPLETYERLPGVPPVGVVRLLGPVLQYPHAHDFLVLLYIERGAGTIAIDGREWRPQAGDAFVIGPRAVVAPAGIDDAAGWTAFFPPDVLDPHSPGAFLSWRAHPLLFPFAGGAAGGAQHLRVPAPERAAWSARFAALSEELQDRRDGYYEAAVAHLTLLLVDVSRLAADVGGVLRLQDEPLLAAVFELIEARYAEPISLRDVAQAVSLSPAHLTTVVSRKTGRTVQQWIAERRMTEARRRLAETEDTVDAIGAAVGYRDAGYFIKTFKRRHGLTPLRWRRAGRGGG